MQIDSVEVSVLHCILGRKVGDSEIRLSVCVMMFPAPLMFGLYQLYLVLLVSTRMCGVNVLPRPAVSAG